MRVAKCNVRAPPVALLPRRASAEGDYRAKHPKARPFHSKRTFPSPELPPANLGFHRPEPWANGMLRSSYCQNLVDFLNECVRVRLPQAPSFPPDFVSDQIGIGPRAPVALFPRPPTCHPSRGRLARKSNSDLPKSGRGRRLGDARKEPQGVQRQGARTLRPRPVAGPRGPGT